MVALKLARKPLCRTCVRFLSRGCQLLAFWRPSKADPEKAAGNAYLACFTHEENLAMHAIASDASDYQNDQREDCPAHRKEKAGAEPVDEASARAAGGGR